MQNLFKLLVFSSLLLSQLGGQSASADFVLGFSDDEGASFATAFDLGLGDTANIGIYLQQAGADSVLTVEGLSSWGLDLNHTSPSFGTIVGASANPVFDISNHEVSTATGFEWEFGESADLGVLGDSILLGSFQYQADSEGSTIFTVKDRLPGAGFGNSSWLTPALTELDEQIFGIGAAGDFQFSVNSASVSAVPEPTSLVLLGGVASMMLMVRRRRS